MATREHLPATFGSTILRCQKLHGDVLWEKEKYPEDLKEPDIELHIVSDSKQANNSLFYFSNPSPSDVQKFFSGRLL